MTVTVSVRAAGRRTTRHTVATAKQAKATSWNAAKRVRRGSSQKVTPAAVDCNQLEDFITATLAQDSAEKLAIANHVESAFAASLAALSG